MYLRPKKGTLSSVFLIRLSFSAALETAFCLPSLHSLYEDHCLALGYFIFSHVTSHTACILHVNAQTHFMLGLFRKTHSPTEVIVSENTDNKIKLTGCF